MPLEPLIDLAAGGFNWLVDLTMRSTLLLAVVAVATTALRAAAPRVRYALWTVAIVGVLVMPVLTLVVPEFPIAGLPRLQIAGPTAGPPALAERPDSSRSLAAPDAGASLDTSAAADRRRVSTTRRIGWPTWVTLAWAAGASVALVRLVLAFIGMTRLTRRATPLGGEAWNGLIARLMLSVRPARPVSWRRSDEIQTPMTWGVRRAVVLVPAGAESWPDERREVVLLHELVHVKRLDWLVRVAAQLTLAMHWLNPLVWLAVRRLDVERERACDDAIIAQGTRPSVYASHLLEIARLMKLRALGAATALSMAHTAQLEGRVVSILDGRRCREPGRLVMVPGLVLSGVVALLVAAIEPAGSAPPPDMSVGVDGLMVRWTNAGGPHRFETSGPVHFNREGTEVTRLGPTASVRLDAEAGGERRQLRITPGPGGGLQYAWLVNGEPRTFDEDARRWMRSMISRGLDRTGRPQVHRYPAGTNLATVAAALDAALGPIDSLEDEQIEIERRKEPLYEQAGRLEAAIGPHDEAIELITEELEELIARRAKCADGSDDAAALDRRIAEARSRRGQIEAARRPLAERLDAVERELDPLIERWNDLQDRIEDIADDAEPHFTRCDDALHAELLTIIVEGLDATVVDDALLDGLTPETLDPAVTAMLEGCCAYFVDPEQRQIVLQVSAETVRVELGHALDEHHATLGRRPDDTDRRALDESIERLARLIGALRLTY